MEQKSTLTTIRPESIDPDATKVVRRLVRHGFEAYLVGGCVRDLLLGRKPKDFDVATSATPPEIKKLFRNCRIIGRRFRLAHIFFSTKIIETSTFRAPPAPEPPGEETAIIRQDNVFGTAKEDALRRDFTINGLFLDVRQNRVIDHIGGLKDLKARRIRTIGDPRTRIPEDPVRIIRAVKFATRLGFTIEPATEAAMVEFRGLIAKCSVARVLEETYRLLSGGHAAPSLELMHRTGVLAVLFPELQAVLGPPADERARAPVTPIHDRSGTPRVNHDNHENGEAERRDAEPDPALATSRDPTPEELAAEQEALDALVGQAVGNAVEDRQRAAQLILAYLEQLDRLVAAPAEDASPPSHALVLASALAGLAHRQLQAERSLQEAVPVLEELVKAVGARLRVSRRDRERTKQILVAQRRMLQRGKRGRPRALAAREYFPEAWQLFQMRCAVTGEAEEIARWRQLLGIDARKGRGRRRRRRRRPRKPQA
jgi:poly(A) polymerase